MDNGTFLRYIQAQADKTLGLHICLGKGGMLMAKVKRVASLDQMPLFLTVDEVAEILAIGRSTAYDLVRCGRIKSIKLGKQYRIPKSSIQELLEND